MTVQPVAIVLVSTFRRGTCRRCHARVVWFRTAGGSWLPFDGEPRVERVRRDVELADAPMVGEVARAVLHWRTCPANQDRRDRAGSRR